MAASGRDREDPNEKVPAIIAEWRTGNYTQRDLAGRHRVSIGFVNKHTKNIEQDTARTVNKLVEAKQELVLLGEQAVNAVHEVVDERTKHLQFFTEAAIKNVQQAMGAKCEGQSDYQRRADTINKGREAVLGKSPDTAIQVNNNTITRIERVIVKHG